MTENNSTKKDWLNPGDAGYIPPPVMMNEQEWRELQDDIEESFRNHKAHALKGVKVVIEGLRNHDEAMVKKFNSLNILFESIIDVHPEYIMDCIADFMEEVIK